MWLKMRKLGRIQPAKDTKDKDSKEINTEKNLDLKLQEYYFEGMNLRSPNWLAKNYHFLTLIKLSLVVLLVINLQQLPVVQVGLSFSVLLGFSVVVIWHQIYHKIFDSALLGDWMGCIREIFHSCSMAVVGIYSLDGSYSIISDSSHPILEAVFMMLLILNVVLELILVVIRFLQNRKLRKQRQKKVPVTEGMMSTDRIQRLSGLPSPQKNRKKPSMQGRKNEVEGSGSGLQQRSILNRGAKTSQKKQKFNFANWRQRARGRRRNRRGPMRVRLSSGRVMAAQKEGGRRLEVGDPGDKTTRKLKRNTEK